MSGQQNLATNRPWDPFGWFLGRDNRVRLKDRVHDKSGSSWSHFEDARYVVEVSDSPISEIVTQYHYKDHEIPYESSWFSYHLHIEFLVPDPRIPPDLVSRGIRLGRTGWKLRAGWIAADWKERGLWLGAEVIRRLSQDDSLRAALDLRSGWAFLDRDDPVSERPLRIFPDPVRRCWVLAVEFERGDMPRRLDEALRKHAPTAQFEVYQAIARHLLEAPIPSK